MILYLTYEGKNNYNHWCACRLQNGTAKSDTYPTWCNTSFSIEFKTGCSVIQSDA